MMELVEIKGLFEMDFGSPSPTILSNDNELFIAFYADKQSSSTIPQERNTIYDTGIFALKFKAFLKYTFGLPGDETIQGHPYSKLGMKSYSFYELRNSDLIKSLQDIEKIHPNYNPEKWKMYKHYILTFHDNMFECIAQDFEIREENTSLYNQATVMLNELSVRHF
ncbi:hypothetical protein SAMN05421780_101798 [Flexibacter flexilis DSM 6793]|uniref:Uncharacterized protein n=1 Tax=Flexibacter flexilis DSM 6793 TaxID=927664 RepID=A0A1I1EGS9_9BACT|nr:hypothetical protein [Flexibacter flexilis]SFB86217.1 hypothetical protein SAMN05421780_101798 [Flexibacter flexilis DSM 6793]